MPQQINLSVTVNRSGIRRETVDGREHFVVSSFTLPADVVMNGILYPGSEIDKHYAKLEDTFAPFGHPQQGGKHISARLPMAVNAFHVGAWNRNVKKVGKRIHLEKWVDREFALNTANGRRLVERLEKMEAGEDIEPIHTSVALFIEAMAANAEQKAKHPGANHVAKIIDMDHDAILMDEPGAATPEQGVGLMVNADLAVSQSMVDDEPAPTMSYREREDELRQAAFAKLGAGGDVYVYVENFTDDHVIVSYAGKTEEYAYTREDGKIVLADTGVTVKRKESWVTNMLNNVKSFLQQQASSPANTKEGDMPMTAEERAELAKATAEALAVNLNTALQPINDAIAKLQDGHAKISEALTANARAEETEMRTAIEAKYGPVIANALSGEPLREMYKSLGTAPTLAPNSGAAGKADKDDMSFIPAK